MSLFGDGEVYGTLCAFAHELRPDLDDRDLETMRVLADVIAAQVERFEAARRERAVRAATNGVLKPVLGAEHGLMAPDPGPRVVLELTEHAAVADYAVFRRALRQHRVHGVRLAIDDVGTGFAGLDQILQVQPDLLELDGSLVSAIDERADKQAMVAAIATYAAGMNLRVMAERIETTAERDTLLRLGLTLGQGSALGWAAPLDELRARW